MRIGTGIALKANVLSDFELDLILYFVKVLCMISGCDKIVRDSVHGFLEITNLFKLGLL